MKKLRDWAVDRKVVGGPAGRVMKARKPVIVRRTSLWHLFGGKCAYCGKDLPKRGYHRDHKEPIVRFKGVRYAFSGRNGCKYPENHNKANIVPACKECNLSKGNCDLETWRGSLRWPGWRDGIVFEFEKWETANKARNA